MAYKITPNYFAIKYWDERLNEPIRLHSISYDKCNYRCGFCNFSNRHSEEYTDYSIYEFEKIVLELMQTSTFFKFTGGEPTLNCHLVRDVRIVKSSGGHVFLDSNGSNPKAIEILSKENMIDVLGISIKGITKEISCQTANISNPCLCWDNVFKTLSIASDYGIRTIVTMVFHKGVSVEGIFSFADLLEKFPNIHLKINNLLITDFQGKDRYEKYDEVFLKASVENLILVRPHWKGRITLVNSNSATTDNLDVIFL